MLLQFSALEAGNEVLDEFFGFVKTYYYNWRYSYISATTKSRPGEAINIELFVDAIVFIERRNHHPNHPISYFLAASRYRHRQSHRP